MGRLDRVGGEKGREDVHKRATCVLFVLLDGWIMGVPKRLWGS